MSLKELKAEVDSLKPDERFELAAYLQHLQEKDDPEYHRKLRKANERIDEGQGVTLEELRKLVAVLDSKGL